MLRRRRGSRSHADEVHANCECLRGGPGGGGRGRGLASKTWSAPVIGITTYAQRAQWGRVGRAGRALAARPRRRDRAGGRAAPCSSRRATRAWRKPSPPSTGSSSRAAATSTHAPTAPSRTWRLMRRTSGATVGSSRCCARPRARPPGPGRLPRVTAAERRAWRRPRPAPPGSGRQRRAQGGAWHLLRARRQVVDDSRLRRIIGERSDVLSHHHQGSAGSAKASSRRPGRTTAVSRRSRIPRSASPSACCGIPRRGGRRALPRTRRRGAGLPSRAGRRPA